MYRGILNGTDRDRGAWYVGEGSVGIIYSVTTPTRGGRGALELLKDLVERMGLR